MTQIDLLLRFSDPEPTINTIEAHRDIIDEFEYCWWGWWKADFEPDHCRAFARHFKDATREVLLYHRGYGNGRGKFLVATCEDVFVKQGAPVITPQEQLTPAYYRHQAFPAWFKFSDIRDADQQEAVERFGYHPPRTDDRTVFWKDSRTEQLAAFSHDATGKGILHLSDLHFGRFHRWRTASKPEPPFSLEEAVLRTIQQHELSDIGVLVVSGDIVSGPLTDDAFQEAEHFLNELVRQIPGLAAQHLVIVPGNHDFPRMEDASPPSDDTLDMPIFLQRTSSYYRRRLVFETAYRQFQARLVKGRATNVTRLITYKLPDGIVANFLQLNSVRARWKSESEYGFVDRYHQDLLPDMAEAYREQKSKGEAVVNFAVLHHHIVSAASLEHISESGPVSITVDAAQLITEFSDHYVRFVLHGHQHIPKLYELGSPLPRGVKKAIDGKWQIVTLGAGSVGVKQNNLASQFPYNSLNYYNFLSPSEIRTRVIPITPNLNREAEYYDEVYSTDGVVPGKDPI
jgi:DNA repair exonuclease SbcCD nuclease subunit